MNEVEKKLKDQIFQLVWNPPLSCRNIDTGALNYHLLTDQILALMEARIADMKADRLTYCAYCGEEFPIDANGTPEAVSNHIHNCPKHPIQDYKAEMERLKEHLVKFVPIQLEALVFSQEQVLGLIPTQAILDYDRAKEVLDKVSYATIASNEAKGQLYRRRKE